MSITATIGGVSVTVLEGSYKFDDTVDLRDTLEFVVHDPSGAVIYQVGQPVELTDSINGFTFSGFVNDAKETNITPNPDNLFDVTCSDNTGLAARRYSYKDYANQFAGDIAVDLLQNYLAQDGVTAAYAIRRDTNQAQFAQGTLSGTVGADTIDDGDLELAPAGTDVTIVENTTSAFSTGTFSHANAQNNTLVPTPAQAIKLTGTMNVAGLSNTVATYKIWSGSYTLGSVDELEYYVWIDPSSPEIKASIDLFFTDGTSLSSLQTNGNADENGLLPGPTTDLSGYADGNWYYRLLGVGGSLAGKVISYVAVVLGGSKTGTYTAYFKFADITNGVNVTFFSGTLQTAQQLQTVGYTNVALSVVNEYNLPYYPTTGSDVADGKNATVHNRISQAYSVDAVKVLRNSIINWSANEPANTKVVIRAALDNGVPVECVNHAPLPNLVPGMNLAGRTLTLYEEFYYLSGYNTEIFPTLESVEVNLNTSYACTKTDATYTTSFSGSEVGAVFSSTIGNSNILNLTGATANWDDPNVAPFQTRYISGSVGTEIFNRSFEFINISSASESKTRFDFAGQHQNFTAEIDIQVITNNSNGLVYRSTNFSTSAGSYAYAVVLSTAGIVLKKGTNTTGGGSATTLTTVSLALTANSWYRVKVVVSGSTHQVYLNDTLQITKTDSSFTATGYLGLISTSTSASFSSASFDNFGVMDNLTGTWTSPNISLNSVANYGNSYIYWRDQSASPSSSDTVLVQYTINGGTTWTTCTNGAPLPGLTSNQSLSGVNLQLKITLTTTTATTMPGIDNLYLLVTGYFSSSGTRIAPALSLSSVGDVGSTLVSWDGTVFTNTTMDVASSIDNGTTWTNIGSGASGSGPIAGINVQPDPVFDTFDSNTSANYTQTALTTNASYVWDTSHSRLTATSGNNALLEYYSLVFANGDIMVDLDQADGSGIVARVSGTTMYALALYDSSAFAHQNAFYLYKIISGTLTQLATGSITFTRGTPYRFHLITNGTTISATMDGTQLASVTDSSITAAGMAGLLSGPLARVYQFQIQAYGENVSSLSVLTKTTITSTDPTVTAQQTDLTVSAYGPSIQPGALIPKANYSVLSGSNNTVMSDLEDLAKQCDNFICDIDKNLNLIFRERTANPSPWIATGTNVLISTPPQIENISSLYRNTQFMNNGHDVIAFTKTFVGDGQTQTWTLDYPVDTLSGVTINNVSTYTIGVQGVDTGRDFYYTAGSPVISQDASDLPLVSTQSVTFAYNAQVTIATELRNDSAIAARAALDSTTGVIQEVEDGTGLSKIAMLQKMQGLLQQYAVDGRTFTFLTMRAGLASNQILTMFVPQFGVQDEQFLITDVSIVWQTTMANNVEVAQPFYSVTATSGPIVGGYERFFSNIIKGVGQ